MSITMTKDPDEDLDYTWDFTDVLASGETISSYEMLPQSPIELHDVSQSSLAVTAYVSPGGAIGQSYDVTCRVTSSATPPRVYDRTIKFKMRSR